MASVNKRRIENIAGDFFVDASCIDCDACRWIAPEVFRQMDYQAAVYHQPATADERFKALQALVACPTASIGTVEKAADIKSVVYPVAVAENVFYCGYHSEQSFGAASYLIQRPDGNILIDSPRFVPTLAKQLEVLGGVKYLYLTHRDDVADHQKFHDHFGCDRILHKDDVSRTTQNVEIQLTGDEPIQFADDVLIIPVAGHTRGHTVLLYRNTFLFTGDHLAYSPNRKHLYAFRDACWYSWQVQTESMKKLQAYSFEWVLPGHGRRLHATRNEMADELALCIAWLQTV
jgi:glyoxylase-like metal-dependent hydrolase (beta-lactamase superfamily II)/ferredoxin